MTPDDPRHGRRAGYIAGCRDACCTDPHRRYQKFSRVRLELQGSQTVPADRVRSRALWWNARGVSTNALTDAAGLGYGTLAELLTGERDVCLRSTERAVLALTWETLPGRALCNADLTRHRIQSLMAAGHSLTWITDQVGLPITGRWRTQERVTVRLAAAVATIYAAAPLDGDSPMTRGRARSRGYQHPLAWDDPGVPAMPAGWSPFSSLPATVDDGETYDQSVVEQVLAGGWRTPTSRADRVEIVARWRTAGRSLADLRRLTGWKPERYYTPGEDAA